MKKLLALGSLVLLSLAACKPVADGGTGPIKIGFIGPLTGEAAAYGLDPLHGVELKAAEINAAGGIGGRMIEIVAEDGKCTGGDAASAAQKLVNVDKVVAIVGGQCSSETLAVAPIVEAAKIVLISPISSSSDVTNAGEFVFRDYPSDALKTKAMAAYFKKKDFTRVAVLSENTDFCVGFRDSLETDLGADAIVFDEVVEPNTKDFRTLMTRLNDVEFDVFVANGQYPATVAAMLQQLREQGSEELAISHDVGDVLETIELGGEAAEGFQVINVKDLPADAPFSMAFKELHGDPLAGFVFGAHAYDALGVLAMGMESVGTDGESLRDFLYDMRPYKGIVGTFSFDENGDAEGLNYVLKEVKDGAFKTIEDAPVK